MFAVAVVAQASVQTITFNGSDIVANAPLTVNTSGTPVIGDGRVDLTTGTIRTYNGATSGDPAAFNAWLGSLGTGQGISSFNLWLQDGVTNQAAMWGETIALTSAYESITTFASAGWTASVYTLDGSPADWGPTWLGRELITYTANSPADYLRPGTDATFGFTADIYGFNDGTSPYQMWVGSGDVVSTTLIDTANGGEFQRAITATATPEPASIIIWGLFGLGTVFGVRVWRRRQRAA
jgi:hypothetical protein